ncbi:hypothetical protein ACL6C3_13745 [Capilliphycus salinus ALCB114379]|uniref:hypothetical protein n=1 Tax=Capilliphycus salinus TaxID=2768948 RepID=UPI0039A6F9A7
MTKPLGYWISSTSAKEQQAITNIEGICGSFLQNLSEEGKYSLIVEISKQLPHTSSSLHPQIKQSIKDLSVGNLLNLLSAISSSF